MRQCKTSSKRGTRGSGWGTAAKLMAVAFVICGTQDGSALAQRFKITRSTLTNGGVIDKTGGSFHASGAIGVPHAREMSGSRFRVSGSSWTKTRMPACIADISGYGECFDETLIGAPPIKHWTGELGPPDGREWGICRNWYENEIPLDGEDVCIPDDPCRDYIVYEEDETLLNSLACALGFVMRGSQQLWPDLELDVDSYILGDLDMSGYSTLKVHDRLSVDGHFTWRGGDIDGLGVTEVGGGLSLTNSPVDLFRGDFKLTGGHGFSNGPLVNLYYGATFEIGPQATFEYQGNAASFYGTNSLLDVRGMFTRSAGDGNATLWAPVDNSGSIHVQTGQFYFHQPGTHSGDVLADPGTILGFAHTQEFTPTSSLTAETVELRSGSDSMVHGTVNISERIDGKGATWTFANDANIIDYGNHLHVERGRVNFNAPIDRAVDFETVTITTPGESSGTIDFGTGQPVNVVDFNMITGSLYGSSPINISGEFNWTNGSFWQGGAITAAGPVNFNATSSTRTISRVLNINNQATFRSGFTLSSGGRVNVAADAVVTIPFNRGGISGGVFNNQGTVLRTSGDGEISISSAIVNDGLFHNQTGTLNFATHPLNGTSTYTGDIISDPGAILKFAGSGHDLQSSSTMTAESLVLWAFDSFVHGGVNISNGIECDGCIWTFASDADIIDYGDDIVIRRGSLRFEAPTDREINFNSVTIENNLNSSTLYFDTGQPVNIGQLGLFDAGSTINGISPINISEQFTWSNGSVLAGGAMTVDGDTLVNPTSSGRTLSRPFINHGTMTFRGGFGMSGSGRIDNSPRGLIDIQYNGRSLSSRVINNAGTITRSANDGTSLLQNTDVNNSGIIDIQQGTLEITTAIVTQTDGETVIGENTTLDMSTSDPFALQGGMLKGTGQYIGDLENSGGTVAPGLSVGELSIDGHYDQPGGTLAIEIDGSEPDKLTVTGDAALAGKLVVTNINGFAPAITDEFVILDAANVTGTFDIVTAPVYEVIYNATNVTLAVRAVSPDLNRDGVVNLLDFQLFQQCFNGSNNGASPSCAVDVDADLDQDGDVDLDDHRAMVGAL